jgi:hypothetical protein
MTYQSPRIYLYKITFEEVPYYYYGVHKEKYFNEEYWGSPVSHKWCWELYTPKKQILEFFNCWKEAQEIEKRLIKPFYNTDKWCLNENVGGILSLDVYRKGGRIAGKINGQRNRENKIGICGMSFDEKSVAGKKGGKRTAELKVGVHGISPEEKSKIGTKNYQMKVGIHALTPEETIENAKKGGNKAKELGLGVHARTKEQIFEDGRKGGLIGGKTTSAQKWECLETGFITNAGNLTKYQRKRDIDTSKRKRIS